MRLFNMFFRCRRYAASWAAIMSVACRVSFATPDTSSEVKANGWGMWTVGHLANLPDKAATEKMKDGRLSTDVVNNEHVLYMDAGVKLGKRLGEYSRMRLHGGIQLKFYVDYRHLPNADYTQGWFVPYLIDATLESSFGLLSTDTVRTELGYMPVKYNSCARNLGEYLFRSSAYPPVVFSGFEVADKVKQLGVRLQWRHGEYLPGELVNDLFVTSEIYSYPIQDITFSFLSGYAVPGRFLEIGAGISIQHALPFHEDRVTPWRDTLHQGVMVDNRYVYVDPATSDTVSYSFAARKGMVRAIVDPKALFAPSWLEDEALKLYGEAALLGLKNYDGWYENRLERMPVMFGFNVPTFRLLDVLSVEAEYYRSPYPNSMYNVWSYRSPAPYVLVMADDTSSWSPIHNDDWKWSVYFSRMIAGAVRISGQVASDHLKAGPYLYQHPWKKYFELVPRTKDWYWMARVSFYF